MATLIWPCILRPKQVEFSLAAMTTSGGQSPTGSEQVVGNSPGRVKISLNGVTVHSKEAVRAWRTIEAVLAGRSGTIMVPVYDKSRAPFPTVEGRIVYPPCDGVPYSDGALFSDGSGFYQPLIVAELAAGVTAGTVSASIRMIYGDELVSGMVFGIGSFAYVITRVTGVDTSGAHPVYSVTFRLPARETIASGEAVEFDNPMVRCRLASDDAMSIALDFWKHSDPSVSFVEDV